MVLVHLGAQDFCRERQLYIHSELQDTSIGIRYDS